MSKLNKANNTSIFFDEILASFSPFILLVLMIVPIKSLIYYRLKYLSYGGIFFTLYACLYFSQRKNVGAKSFTLAI